jgi:LPXTG-site transpeptidase (sortase) family protein
MPGNRHFVYTYMYRKVLSLIVIGMISLLMLVVFGPYFYARLWPVKSVEVDVLASQFVDNQKYPTNTLQVPSLGIEAPIQYISEQTEDAYQTALQHGVVHFPGTALPGQSGNVYIFGHSSDYLWSAGDYKTIFARLPEIVNEADIFVTDDQGQRYKYQVIETKVVNPKDLSVLDQGNYQRSILSLQTSYPLGTALQRFVVIAELRQ